MATRVDSNKAWDLVDDDLIQYNTRQYENKYRSTDFIISNLKQHLRSSAHYNILDVGCGGGGNLYHIAKEFEKCTFTGIDLNEYFINFAKNQHKLRGLKNTNFKIVDFRNMMEEKYNIVGSSQFLEVLDFDKAKDFKHMCFQRSDNGVYFQALFTEKPLDYEINIHDHIYNKVVPYNIFSIEGIKQIASKYNFKLTQKKQFIIDVDLPDNHLGRGTYTVKKQNGERMMFSDILNLPWYFLYFKKQQ